MYTGYILTFICGLMIGGLAGVIWMSIVITGKESDKVKLEAE